MRRLLFIITSFLIIGSLIIVVGLFRSGTSFSETSSVEVFIPTGTISVDSVKSALKKSGSFAHPLVFNSLISFTDYKNNIIPGRYKIDKGMSSFRIFRKLSTGRTDDVKLVINKLRTKEDIITLLDRKLEVDSNALANYFNNPDSVKAFGLDTQNVVTLIIPNTYLIEWTSSVSRFMKRMKTENEKFWNAERLEKLKKISLTKEQAYILASIVEEETNKHDEKPLISSVYLNRLKRNMPLGADPTVKFALRDFTIKRIRFAHIRNSSSSPYNTYTNKGLPPGPICTPSSKSIDGVLNAAQTNYIFFCARADFSGYHSFASNDKEHFKNAKAYQSALDSLRIQ